MSTWDDAMAAAKAVVDATDERAAVAAAASDQYAEWLRAARQDLAASRAELAALNARLAELEAQLSPWVPLYDADLTDPTAWTLRNETQSNDNSRNLPANVTFGAYGMAILGRRETGYTRPFTTGDALGNVGPLILPNHFRVEVVGTAPHGIGLWPCVLWLRPANGSDGEIDLMENFGGKPYVKATLHNEYGTNHKMIGRQIAWSTLPNPDPAAEHTYVIEKTPNRILITVDGRTLMDATPTDAPVGFDWARIFENPSRTWYPRVTLQIGCGTANPECATGQPPADWNGPTELVVSSLRAWTPR